MALAGYCVRFTRQLFDPLRERRVHRAARGPERDVASSPAGWTAGASGTAHGGTFRGPLPHRRLCA